MTTLCLPLLPCMRIVYCNSEHRVVNSCFVAFRPCREFFVGRHERACYVVRHQIRLRVDVQQANDVIVPHDPPATVIWYFSRWLHDPMVVGVVKGVAGDLLAL